MSSEVTRFPVTMALLRGGDPDLAELVAEYVRGSDRGATLYFHGAAKRTAARLERSSWGPAYRYPEPKIDTPTHYPLDCGSRFD